MESTVTMSTLDFSSLPVELDFEHRSTEANSEQNTPKCKLTTRSRRDQLHKLSRNPIFHDLQTTLRSECDAQDSVPSALLASTGHVPHSTGYSPSEPDQHAIPAA